jgi:HD-GYP domain-containing protein (c-di-GMP phosphodiesterase class II)
MNLSFKTAGIYFRFVFREFASPLNYILAFFIGAVINISQGNQLFASYVPFLVPVLVQTFSKASVKFGKRNENRLLMLPRERTDPAFIMDSNGAILAAIGRSEELFKTHGINHLKDFISTESCDEMCSLIHNSAGGADSPGTQKEAKPNRSVEVFSQVTGKWYNAKFHTDPATQEALVWFDDITERRLQDIRLQNLRSFSNEIITSLDSLIVENDSYNRLARLITEDGYSGVFIAEKTKLGDFSGYAYKNTGDGVEVSPKIEIQGDSEAPVLLSQKEKRVISGELSDFTSRNEFESHYRFDSRVQDFFGESIVNFINYFEGDIAIIAFNKGKHLGKFDRIGMETLVNSARIVNSLLRLAHENDVKFLQSVSGLCAAAEFSDEITGLHIFRVNKYSELLAGKICQSGPLCSWIGQVAAIHDIGKVAIPHIIKLPRKLTEDERQKMEMHTIFGAQILQKMIDQGESKDPRMQLALRIALNHHQQWNGNGYPSITVSNGAVTVLRGSEPEDYLGLRPLKEEEIPIEALIVSLADKYDALRAARQYKPEFSHEKAVTIIEKDDRTGLAGEEIFGPQVFALFQELKSEFAGIYEEMRG